MSAMTEALGLTARTVADVQKATEWPETLDGAHPSTRRYVEHEAARTGTTPEAVYATMRKAALAERDSLTESETAAQIATAARRR